MKQTDFTPYREPMVTETGSYLLGASGMGSVEFFDLRNHNLGAMSMIGAISIGEPDGVINLGRDRLMSARKFSMSRVEYTGVIRISLDNRIFSSYGTGKWNELFEVYYGNLSRVNPKGSGWTSGEPTDKARDGIQTLVQNVLFETSYPWHEQGKPSRAAREYLDGVKGRLGRAVDDVVEQFIDETIYSVPLKPKAAKAYHAQVEKELLSHVNQSFIEAYAKYTHADHQPRYQHNRESMLEIRRKIDRAIGSFLSGDDRLEKG